MILHFMQQQQQRNNLSKIYSIPPEWLTTKGYSQWKPSSLETNQTREQTNCIGQYVGDRTHLSR